MQGRAALWRPAWARNQGIRDSSTNLDVTSTSNPRAPPVRLPDPCIMEHDSDKLCGPTTDECPLQLRQAYDRYQVSVLQNPSYLLHVKPKFLTCGYPKDNLKKAALCRTNCASHRTTWRRDVYNSPACDSDNSIALVMVHRRRN